MSLAFKSIISYQPKASVAKTESALCFSSKPYSHTHTNSRQLDCFSKLSERLRVKRNVMVQVSSLDLGFDLNPQNVPPPKIVPSAEFNPKQIVEIQLNALKDNDDPLQNHGIQTMYEFANNVGSLDASMYFGYRKDLYHFDHFLGIFWTKLGNLINLNSYSITNVSPIVDGLCTVKVLVHGSKGSVAYVFTLKQREFGRLKGSWMTEMIVVDDNQ